MGTWNIEITDTFGGEANYCWVKCYRIKAKSILGAVQRISRMYGSGWVKDWSDGDSARYDLKDACVCMFISWSEDDEPTEKSH